MVCSQFTGNDNVFLWMKGQTTLVKLITKNLKAKQIDDFWIYLKLKRSIIPVACTSNTDGSKIFGFGMDSLTEETILIFYKKKGKGKPKRANHKLSSWGKYIDKLTCCEASLRGKMIYVGGSKKGKSFIGAIRFTHELKPLKFEELDSKIEEVSSMSRVMGTDILLCGCPSSLMLVKLDKKKSVFIILCKYNNLGHFRVGRALFYERHLYAYIPAADVLIKFEYQKALDYKTFYEIEHGKPNEVQKKKKA